MSWECCTADSLREGSENQHVAGNGDRDGHADEASAHEGHADEVLDHEGHAGQVSGERKNSLGKWRKGNPCYMVAKSLASLCPCPEAPWKAELHCDQSWCLARELSKQRSTQAAAWLLLKAYSQMREQREAFKRAFIRAQTELLSQRSPQGIEKRGWPYQPPGKKIKANQSKQRLLGLNPSNKDALKGFQKRAPKLTRDFSLLPKRLLTSDLIPKGQDVAPRFRSPWQRSCMGDVAGRKKEDLKSQRFSAQPKKKPWEAWKKTAFKPGSLWKSSDGVMSHGAVEVKPLWRPQKKSSAPSVFKQQPQKAASGVTRQPLEVATISLPCPLAAARVEPDGAWRRSSGLQVTSGSIPEVETPRRVFPTVASLSRNVQTELTLSATTRAMPTAVTGAGWPQKHQDSREGDLENRD